LRRKQCRLVLGQFTAIACREGAGGTAGARQDIRREGERNSHGRNPSKYIVEEKTRINDLGEKERLYDAVRSALSAGFSRERRPSGDHDSLSVIWIAVCNPGNKASL
jgi:hypothetical protein